MFFIFIEEEFKKMNEIQRYNQANKMKEANREILDKEKEMDLEEEEMDEEENENNKIINLEIEKTKYVDIWQEEGIYYINKKVNKLEYEIITKLNKYEHFPEILREEKLHNEYIITMPYYEGKKINFNENIWFVKNYIKSLLTSIKKLNDIGYVHGDIKPANFIYNNPKYYYLIDFNASGEINIKNENKKIASFPYMPPEKNKYSIFFNNQISNEKSDLWSVGIILLQFITKDGDIFSSDRKSCEEKSLFQYSKLYGSNKREIKIEKKIQFYKKLDNYQPNLINYNYKREEKEKENIINLINNLLQVDVNKRIDLNVVLKNDFLKMK